MASKFEIRPKGRITLVGLEIIALGLMVTAILKDKYSFDTFMAIICSISGSLVISALFFLIRLFRYAFSLFFSLVWAYVAFQIAEDITDSRGACWLAAGLVMLFSLALHKDYFDFESGRT